MIGHILGLYRGNGVEHGNYHLGFRVPGPSLYLSDGGMSFLFRSSGKMEGLGSCLREQVKRYD